MIVILEDNKLCACGCGKPTISRPQHKYKAPKYIRGHARRDTATRKCKFPVRVPLLTDGRKEFKCKCGCNETIQIKYHHLISGVADYLPSHSPNYNPQKHLKYISKIKLVPHINNIQIYFMFSFMDITFYLHTHPCPCGCNQIIPFNRFYRYTKHNFTQIPVFMKNHFVTRNIKKEIYLKNGIEKRTKSILEKKKYAEQKKIYRQNNLKKVRKQTLKSVLKHRQNNLERVRAKTNESVSRYYKLYPEKKKEVFRKWSKTDNGKNYLRKKDAKRRHNMGFDALNAPFENSEGHHINKIQVVYIPKELHQKYKHNHNIPETMIEINRIAMQYLFDCKQIDCTTNKKKKKCDS